MSAQPWSVVLGAGLMGRLLAHALAHEGHRVEVFEAQQADAQGAAARVAAAMLAPLAESAITELPQRTWVGLTDEEIEILSYEAEGNTWTAVELAEAKLKQKNGYSA